MPNFYKMKFFKIAPIVSMLLIVNCLYSQQQDEKKTKSADDYWLFGAGFNAVDDTGLKLRQYFDVNDNWHIAPHPSRLSAGYFLGNGLGFEFIGTYNKYNAGKIVDGRELLEDLTYVGLDTKVSFDLNKIVGETGWFDPYVAGGAGYTWVGSNGRPTANAGVGFNTWFNERWGLNFQTWGKFSLKETATNHLQHSIGVVYKLKTKKEGEIQKDSIITPVIEEVKDTLPKEPVVDEEALRKAEEEARRKAEEAKKQQMLNELNDIGEIYFDFDSSYLTPPAKAQLDKLVAFMNKYPETVIEAGSHADSRGTDAYNNWLTERRANRVRDYLISKGIDANRINSNGFGESQLVNGCSNGVKCTEAEHRLNRRSNFGLKEN